MFGRGNILCADGLELVRIESTGATVYKPMYVLCGILILILVLLHRQNVVIVGAGRSSRSAKFATSSELLYLLNLLYNMPSECCDEYNLYNLNQKSSVWCFAFSHTSTFELIPQSRGRPVGSLGDNWWRIRLFPIPIGDSRCRQRLGLLATFSPSVAR